MCEVFDDLPSAPKQLSPSPLSHSINLAQMICLGDTIIYSQILIKHLLCMGHWTRLGVEETDMSYVFRELTTSREYNQASNYIDHEAGFSGCKEPDEGHKEKRKNKTSEGTFSSLPRLPLSNVYMT